MGLAPLLDTTVKLALLMGTSLEDVSMAELAPRLVCHLVAWSRERCPPHPSPPDADKALGSREQESWPSPSWAAALGRASPAPCLGNTGELTCWQGHCKPALRAGPIPLICHVVVWARERYPPPLPFAPCSRLESWPWGTQEWENRPVPQQLQHLGEWLVYLTRAPQ